MQNVEKRIWTGKIALVITGLVLLVGAGVAALFYLGRMSSESKKIEFAGGGGYIISSVLTEDGVTSSRQYFDANTTYRPALSDEVKFNNTSGEDVKVGTDSFVHYADGSIGILKKVSILDLKSLGNTKEQVVTYYNLLPPDVLKYSAGNFVAEMQGERVAFDSVLMKISDNRYLAAGPTVVVRVGGVEKTIKNGYVEISFFDGDIIRVENQELTYQSIADEVSVEISGVRVDLRNRMIFKDDVDVLDLGLITIDSDDNIVLSDYSKEEEEMATGDAEEEVEEKKNPLEGLENVLNDLMDGVVSQTVETNEVNEYERGHDPVFTVTSFEVTANTFNATVEVTDRDGLLTGDTRVDIIENSSNRPIYQNRLVDGETFFEVTTENLNPDTDYVFVVTSNYMKDGSEMSRAFIQKTFVTEAVGVFLEENYVTTSAVDVLVKRSDYSRVRELTAVLSDAENNVLASREVNFERDGNSVELNFGGLNSNTRYTVRLEDFHYYNLVLANRFSIEKSMTTLKRRPTLGNTTFTMNKRDGLFNVGIANVVDPDYGIVAYRYELFDARTVTIDQNTHELLTGEPVYVVEKSVWAGVDIPVDDDIIKREVPYVFRVVAVFNDNKFERELITGVSGVMKLDGREFPKVTFVENEITFERINGRIVIIDDGGVLDTSKVITVEYKDSVGEGDSFTTMVSSALDIPFRRSGLRKNESYVISLYGTVDLKDANNPPIDNCYIGSVIVNTKDTNPFALRYEVKDKSKTAFTINAQLMMGDGGDTELEANTLSGITFNIYDGTDTSGRLIRSSRKVDQNVDNYESTLRQEYYDNEFTITPSTFGLRNKDLSTGMYTIEITGASDYTKFPNEIPITNNIIVVRAEGSLPDVPPDTEDAVEIGVIVNGDLPNNERRDDLALNTIVGYSFLAEFDNSSRFMKEIYYKIHAEDGTVVKEVTYRLPAGQIVASPIEVFFDGDGTVADVDMDFRRGNKYYVTYTVGLDTQDSDGVVDEVWPSDGTILRSRKFSAEKQKPVFLAYPMKSDVKSFNWQYSLLDVDKTLTSDLHYLINDLPIGMLQLNGDGGWHEILFDNLISGELIANYRYRLMKTEGELFANVISQKFDGLFTPVTPEYSITVENNRAVFRFLEYDTNLLYERIASIKVEIRNSADSTILKTFEGLKFEDDGTFSIGLSEMADLVGRDLLARVYFYYDSGIEGFVLDEDRVALERKTKHGYDYYTMTSRGLVAGMDVFGSDFKYVFNAATNKLNLTDSLTNKNVVLDTTMSSGGVMYNDSVLIAKQLQVRSVKSNIFRFNYVMPTVRVKEIAPDLLKATVKGELLGGLDGNIKDNKIYLKLYKSDSTWVSSELINDNLEVPIVNGEFETEILGLELGTQYYFRVFAEVKNGGVYEMMQLFDADEASTLDKTYRFVTLSQVAVEDIEITYKASSQASRRLDVSYSFDRVVAVDGIRYEVWKVDVAGNKLEQINLNIPIDADIQKNMLKSISIPSGCGVETGAYYAVYIIPYALSGTERVDISETASEPYYFSKLMAPYIAVTSTLDSDTNTITFKVVALDRRHVVVNNNYTIEITNANGDVVTPAQYTGVTYDMNSVKYFEFDTMNSFETYLFSVKYLADLTNGGESTYTPVERTYRIRTSDVDQYLGVISVAADANNNQKIRLVFNGASKISRVKRVHYLIESSGDMASWDEQEVFVPHQVTNPDGSMYYYYTLSGVSLREPGNYYIQLQFSDAEGNVLTTSSLEYLYMTGGGV